MNVDDVTTARIRALAARRTAAVRHRAILAAARYRGAARNPADTAPSPAAGRPDDQRAE